MGGDSLYELVISGATVADGSGSPAFRADVGIAGGKIACICRLSPDATPGTGLPAKEAIDARGLVLAPGFVDIHNHSDLSLLIDPWAQSAACQGVTTVVVGNCGFSPAPWPGADGGEHALVMKEDAAFLSCGVDVRWEWRSFAEYLAVLDAKRPAVNVVALVGHAAIREQVLGRNTRAPDALEMRRMRALLEQALADGAAGMSSGLIYYPSCYAQTSELIELATLVGEANKVYATHIRGEGETLFEALGEAVEVARRAGVSTQVSHLKAESRPMWGRMGDALEVIDRGRAEGVNIDCDQYPYTAYATSLSSFLPPEVVEGDWRSTLSNSSSRLAMREVMDAGRPGWTSSVKGMEWSDFVIGGTGDANLDGRDLETLAGRMGKDPHDVVFDLLLEFGLGVRVIGHAMSNKDVERCLARPDIMVGSDGVALSLEGELGSDLPHPRSFGTFPRVLGFYSRERGLLALEAAVHKMTGLPARKLGLKDRGLVREGYYADLVLFDAHLIQDTATFEQPRSRPRGIYWVIVNGCVALGPTGWGERSGRVIR